ncbi:MAG: hypothetical protein GY777_01605 [Candidatus Brocadiaceae bacterium]|nr:hypothetical protein [Candidatus Brocadiaceae bacterium]
MINIIAEIGINHDGNVSKAFKLIAAAKRCGADIVKFQMHLPDEQMLRDTKAADYVKGSIYDLLTKVSLSLDNFTKIKKCCDDNDIEFMCTPFSNKAVDWLEEIGVSRYKIGSGELTKLDFIRYIAEKKKPVIFSTGMSTFAQVKEALDLLSSYLEEIVVMQCTSLYPPTYEQINLNVIDIYRELIRNYQNKKIDLGFSDHSKDNYACIGAVAKGVKYIEKHFTLDKQDEGPDHAISADITDFKSLVQDIRIMERCCGKPEKLIYEDELPVIKMARHSLVILKDIQLGEKLTDDNLGTKRPGDGIPASEFYNYLNKKEKKPIKKNTLLLQEDVF